MKANASDHSSEKIKSGEKPVGGVWLFPGHPSELTSNVITEIIKPLTTVVENYAFGICL